MISRRNLLSRIAGAVAAVACAPFAGAAKPDWQIGVVGREQLGRADFDLPAIEHINLERHLTVDGYNPHHHTDCHLFDAGDPRFTRWSRIFIDDVRLPRGPWINDDNTISKAEPGWKKYGLIQRFHTRENWIERLRMREDGTIFTTAAGGYEVERLQKWRVEFVPAGLVHWHLLANAERWEARRKYPNLKWRASRQWYRNEADELCYTRIFLD